MQSNKVLLIIMDGWGIAEDPSVSAIDQGETPFYRQSLAAWPTMRLEASGLQVGLPEGQMGNSEVGHMNIGAGRIVYQDLVRINIDTKNGSIGEKEAFKSMINYCEAQNKPLHLLGLISDGGVHSHIDHVKGIVSLLSKTKIPAVYIHCFMDGRDTGPNMGISYIQDLEAHLKQTGTGEIASVVGRYFAMDRDKRWERVKEAYDLLIEGKGAVFSSAEAVLKASYEAEITDEFVKAAVIHKAGKPVATIQPDDAIFFFNFRTDRGRQLTEVLTQKDMPDQGMHTLPLHYTTMTRYDESFKGIHVIYEKDNISMGLGEYLAKQGKTQIRIAETEKYPHVTFFFNGGREEKMDGERYLMCPSPKVPTYDLQPEMSAGDITDAIVPELEGQTADFICLNFANPDMVGHTGVFEAAIKACETVDGCTQTVAETALKNDYIVLITADHGNADKMKNPDGSAHTAHTTALVPLILLDNYRRFTFGREDRIGKLGDLAPTILTLMGLAVPEEMTGEVLVQPLSEYSY